jgi:hypothetical protein
MQWLIGSGMRFGRLVMAAALGLIIVAATHLKSAPVDVYPEFDPPAVQIQAEALGLSAAEVEQLITVPVEQDLLNGVPWLDRIHSVSMPGLSAIDMTFQPGTDLFAARQLVEERMTQAHALPNVGSPPIMIQPLSSLSRVDMIRLSSRTVSLIDMSGLARWKIRPRLMGVPGVANVAIYGQRDRQLQVLRPRALALEGQSAHFLDVDLAVAGDDSDRTRDVTGVEVTREHVSHAGQPFRREATAGHSLLLILSIFVRYICSQSVLVESPLATWQPTYPRLASSALAGDLRNVRSANVMKWCASDKPARRHVTRATCAVRGRQR